MAAGEAPLELEPVELKRLSLEELMGVKVSSVGRREQSAFLAPAAVSVLTAEDIERSGGSQLPELLREVPGVEVARVNAHQWAVSIRGFNNPFANKLLVLMDGRSVYTPLFSGVFWVEQDTLLQDLERIEIVRGPGAALWGANAVNGVINFVTKSARDTQGLLLSGGGGSWERAFADARYGVELAENLHLRVYGKFTDYGESTLPEGGDANDAWWVARGGARLDWQPSDADRATLQGDAYWGVLNQTRLQHSALPPYGAYVPEELNIEGANAMARWTHEFPGETELAVQLYYDHTRREMGITDEARDTLDFDYQLRFFLTHRHEILWGGGYRMSRDSLADTYEIHMREPSRTTHLVNTFLQDDIIVVPNRLKLTLGAKVEYSDFSGWDLQPNARLAWTPHDAHFVWASAARAIRTPARLDQDGSRIQTVLPPTPLNRLPTEIRSQGSPDFTSEKLVAYEAGYRTQVIPSLSLDVAVFYNDYNDLQGYEAEQLTLDVSPPAPRVVQALTLDNSQIGDTYGVEVTAVWQPAAWWRLQANYTFLEMQLRSGSTTDTSAEDIEGQNPQHQFSARTSLDLPGHVQFDVGLRYVGQLSSLGIEAYLEMDARLAWKPTRNLEISVVGANLLHPSHQEFLPVFAITQTTEVPRSITGRITWRF